MMASDVTVHDRSGLLLSSSPPPSDEDINQAELVGIVEATDWAKKTRLSPNEVKFWQRLHAQMFGQVWSWAGEWRQHEPNIGVPPQDIQPDMKNLQDDLAFWLSEKCDMAALELIARFHHRLVYIHPFSNGNGRWGRLITDVLAARVLGMTPLTWARGGHGLRDIESDERKKYIATIKAADKGEFGPLMEYLKSLNPELA
ncbi:MAG: mobile mystery protein B [Gammaproteobacteria bacterium]|nr:MAG: mobile mystery protein B [Gammaproteobacteria bacterium]RLA29992.1 MAG: mobile mystery protein B [Gammaproteobacteria bacterium]